MGNYTELVFGCSLKEDAPQEVIDFLNYAINQKGNLKESYPHIYLFNSASSSFGGPTISVFENDLETWKLSIRCNVKNDKEIKDFIDWIMPHVESGAGENELLGYWIYEEDKEPTLIYRKK